MERRTSSQPNHPGVEYETYADVHLADLSELRRNAIRGLNGNGITEVALEEDLRKIAIKEKDKDLERFTLTGEVSLERMLFPSGSSMIELYGNKTHTYTISYNDDNHVAEVTRRIRKPQALIPSKEPTSI